VKEIILLGLGNTGDQCPFSSDLEIWSCNNFFNRFPDLPLDRVSKNFIMDGITEIEFDYPILRKLHCIVAPRNYDSFSNIEIYPIDEVLVKFKTKFFSNTVCYMIAYALLKEYERIYFYGMDMMSKSSYVVEKGAVEYWMGIAHALGIEIINTKGSATGKTIDGRMYGDWDNHHDEKLPEDLAQETRDLVQTIPGLKDLSEEWVKDSNGNWIRREQRVVMEGHPLLVGGK